MKRLGNESGYIYILAVVVLTSAILVSLALTYVYTENRIRYHARIRETYKLVNATEVAAQIVKAAWDITYAQLGYPTPNIVALPANFNPNLPAGAICGGGFIQVENVDDPANPYCFQYTANIVVIGENNNLRFKLKDKYEEKDFNSIQKFVAKLDTFFERSPKNPSVEMTGLKMTKPTVFSWLLAERQAWAVSPSVTFAAVSSDCSTPTNPGCMQCSAGVGAGASSVCTTISVCPNSWSGCPGTAVTQSFRISTAIDSM